MDFYPNGGQRQPGCGLSNFMSIKHISNASLSEIVACDHMRAIDLYSDSFLNRTECPSIGYECANVVSFDQVKSLINFLALLQFTVFVIYSVCM